MSLSAVIHGDHFSLSRLRTQCVTPESRRQPLTHSREFIFCLRGFSDELSSWKMFLKRRTATLFCLFRQIFLKSTLINDP